jgi:hypothetical protein
MRPIALFTTSLLACATLTAQRAHPHFDDGGTLPWYKTFAEAKAAAKKADRLILVEYGRKA